MILVNPVAYFDHLPEGPDYHTLCFNDSYTILINRHYHRPPSRQRKGPQRGPVALEQADPGGDLAPDVAPIAHVHARRPQSGRLGKGVRLDEVG